MARIVTLAELRDNQRVLSYIQKADEYLEAIGYTEHGLRHAQRVSHYASQVLAQLQYPPRTVELAAIAGFLHDIGNLVRREEHEIASAILAERLLADLGMDFEEAAVVIRSIANHDEKDGMVTHELTAALVLADKADVHRSRVRNINFDTQDIHDRVNYAATESRLVVQAQPREILLDITIDTGISSVMEYFEIFLSRMIISRRAAEFLKCKFSLMINNTKLY